ncbi:MAG: asparagine synthase (glutamine-hydrolyzing) [Chloroflexota bacterium]
MCGIAGILRLDGQPNIEQSILKRMADVMRHRGPDGEGFFVDGPIGFAHRRLSIIDLATGDQPMASADGALVIIYNGEIYNYRELRARLQSRGCRFRTQSDTEVILQAYAQYGDRCVDHLNGMFAFAIWDKHQRRLFLARDRLGVKPLYYWSNGQWLLFASEVKAFLEFPDFRVKVNLAALDEYLTFVYTLGAHTFFDGVKRLLPGHTLAAANQQVSVTRYWDLSFTMRPVGQAQSTEELEALLEDAVRMQLVSDVPLGSFLSGGLDTSSIVAMAMRHASPGLKTFSVGFTEGARFDELPYAQIVASKFGTDHHQIVPSARGFLEFFPRAVWHLDEPAVGPPAIPTFFVSRLAREQGVKVLLSGEGGDELFAGYPRAVALHQQQLLADATGTLTNRWRAARTLAGFYMRRTLGWRAGLALFTTLADPAPRRYAQMQRALAPRVRAQLYSAEFRRQVGDTRALEDFAATFEGCHDTCDLNRAMYVDVKTYLAALLHVADRMSMAASVESRVPLLDHRLVQWAAALAPALKTDGFATKALLRQTAACFLPAEIVNRPKVGFQTPFEVWARQPEWYEFLRDTLLSASASQRGYFEPNYVRRVVDDLYEGSGRGAPLVWQLLNVELWHRAFLNG